METAFVRMTMATMQENIDAIDGLEINATISLLTKIWQGYAKTNPTYHNGIHGADVC
jgi:hypothetical protein